MEFRRLEWDLVNTRPDIHPVADPPAFCPRPHLDLSPEALACPERGGTCRSPTINGHPLRARGRPPGPRYRLILTALRAAWLDGKIDSVDQETALLEEI